MCTKTAFVQSELQPRNVAVSAAGARGSRRGICTRPPATFLILLLTLILALPFPGETIALAWIGKAPPSGIAFTPSEPDLSPTAHPVDLKAH
jgi:hypothetical protein